MNKNNNFENALCNELWPQGGVHIPNLQDEEINGNDHKENDEQEQKDQLGLKYYLCRMQGAFKDRFTMFIPDEYKDHADELSEYHQQYELSNLPKKNIIPVHTEEGENFSQSCIKDLQHLTKHQLEGLLIPIISSKKSQFLAKELGLSHESTPESAYSANHKNNALTNLKKLGVEVPYEEEFHSEVGARQLFNKFKQEGINKMLAKASRGASGQAIWEITDEASLEKFLSEERVPEIMEMHGFAMQELIEDIVASPNILFYVGPQKHQDRHMAQSYQILAKNHPDDLIPQVHMGNKGPLKEEHWDQMPEIKKDIDTTMDWLRSIEAYGTGGIDVVIYRDPATDTLKHKLIEINFRFNGNSAAAMMAQDKNSPFFAADNNAKVPANVSLNDYVNFLGENHYSPESNEGVFVTNAVTGEIGKMQIGVMANTREKLNELMEVTQMVAAKKV